MTPERLRLLESIVQAALDTEDSAREGFLDSACRDDPALRQDVDALLRAHEAADSGVLAIPALAWESIAAQARASEPREEPADGLDDSAGVDAPRAPGGELGKAPAPVPQERLGPYRILSVLGEGGMGTVYLAQQSEPIRRRVAIKLIRPDMVTPEAVRRFEAERQTLARMNHPNIAQALEAGTAADGRLYFVMEFVPGLPITKYCDRHRLDVHRRLALFVALCSGIQHAHEKGILHRDIKPSNVLVTEVGDRAVPKIIDFGVAKVMDRPFHQETLFTGARLIGTPAYWSPEALRVSEWGTDLDTRSDVYSLGALLYELLVGVLPFDAHSEGLLRVVRRILEEEPAAPSGRLAALEPDIRRRIAHQRSTDAPALAHRLGSDLGWITLKALSKERAERYGSPADLAADIGRHLRHEPVAAGPPRATYRLKKFIRRHRTGVASAALVAIALLVATVGMTLLARRAALEAERADREADAAQEVSEFLVGLFQLSHPGEARGRGVTAYELLELGANRARVEMADQPLTQARLMDTIGTVYRNLGLLEPAARLLEEALEIREGVLDGADLEVAASLHHLATLYVEEGRYEEAEAHMRRALAIRAELLGPYDLEVARSINNLGGLYSFLGRYGESEPLLRRALEIKERILVDGHHEVGTGVLNLGYVHLAQGRLDLAEAEIERGLAITRRRSGEDHPDIARGLHNLAMVHMRQERYDEAEPLLRQALALAERVLGPGHYEVAQTLSDLAELNWHQGRGREAEPLFRQALDLAERALGPDHDLVAHVLAGLARLCRDEQRFAEAELFYARALAIRERAFAAGHPRLDEILREYGAMLAQQQRSAEAEDLLARVQSR